MGYASAWQFAQHGLGLGRSRASELLVAGRRLRELAVLDRAFADGVLCWSKVRAIARVATPETEAAWVAKGRDVSVQEVEALVSVSRPGDEPGELGKGLPQARFKVRLVLDRLQHEQWEMAREKLGQELGRAVTEGELVDELVRLLLASDADGSVPGRKKVDGSLFRVAVDEKGGDAAMEAAASDAAVPPRMRRAVMARDGLACRCCEGRRSLMVHHVVWWSLGGPTVKANLVTLCARCHGLVHEGLLFVDGEPGRWTFRDREGRALQRARGRQPRVRVRGEFSMRAAGVVRRSAGGGHGEFSMRTDGADATGSEGPVGARIRARSCDGRPQSLAIEEIPDVLDRVWWRAHQHLLEWGKDGKSMRIRKEARRLAGGRVS